jgi:NAD(P)H dehydrogenase (quinone)
MLVVTAATGHLGRLVVQSLLAKVPAREIAVAVRSPEKAKDLAARGVEVRRADYARPETLGPAFAGAERLLLISSSEIGQRAAQHAAAIRAARAAGVKLLAYTSILRADGSRIGLAEEHRATEADLRASGLPYVLLRNGWYHENFTEHLAPALQHGALVGCSGAGRVAGAARADYADAAVAVLTGNPEKTVYELAGEPFTKADLAAEVSRQAGRPIAYADLPAAEYRAVLAGAGLPGPVADMYVDFDVKTALGDLDGDSGELRRLIGRPLTPLAASVRAGLGS